MSDIRYHQVNAYVDPTTIASVAVSAVESLPVGSLSRWMAVQFAIAANTVRLRLDEAEGIDSAVTDVLEISRLRFRVAELESVIHKAHLAIHDAI